MWIFDDPTFSSLLLKTTAEGYYNAEAVIGECFTTACPYLNKAILKGGI